MTATRAEILRALPPELSSATSHDGRLRGAHAGGEWELELVCASPLRAGTLVLEVTELVIRLRGLSQVQQQEFLARLEQYTRRGGG